MLSKKENFTTITPIPGFIPRQLAIDILHSHSEVITLNPLVIGHEPIKAPNDALADEYYSTWYRIDERIQYIPGMGKLGSGKISFEGCFHDMPWGLQTHIRAPMGVDLRNKYRIEGNQPGIEPPQHLEIGLAKLGAPTDGLYLREDIEIKCNITMVSFVKAQMKSASKEMVQRIIKKAELLDAGVLQAMFENGKLRTVNPLDRTMTMSTRHSSNISPTGGYGAYQRPPGMPMSPNMQSAFLYQQQPQSPPPFARPDTANSAGGYPAPPVHHSPDPQTGTTSFPAEMPGDLYHPQTSAGYSPQQTQQMPAQLHGSQPSPSFQSQGQHSPGFPSQHSPSFQNPQPSPGLQPPMPSPGLPPHPGANYRVSAMTVQSQGSAGHGDGRWSQPQPSPSLPETNRTSMSSDGAGGGMQSPGLHGSFAAELPAHKETQEEHFQNAETLKKLENRTGTGYVYNPQDYARKITQ